MKNDGTDWNTLVEKRLAEARQNRQAEAQAAQPPPGPEAAAQVIDRIRAAQEAETQDMPAEPPPPAAEAARTYRGSVRPPMSERERRVSERHLHRFSWRRARRTLFLLVLLALFLGGVGLIFSPQLKQIFSFLGPDRDTAENGLIAPPGPGDRPKPASEPPKPVRPPEGQSPAPAVKPPATQDPASGEQKPEPKPDPEPKREPEVKPPEKKPEEDKKPMVPLEPAKPVDPSVMPPPPKPPEPPKLPAMPKGPWDDQGQEKPRPAEPRDSVG